MILRQHYLDCLAHASYLVADERSGVAAVVDPQRDVDRYDSLRDKLLALPDDTIVYPAHGPVPLRWLLEIKGELPRERALVVYCSSGYRSAIAASLLLARGRRRVADLAGGLAAWSAAG